MTPYAIGDRVVCLHPSPHVGTVSSIHGGVLKVTAADGSVWCVGDDLLRPAMPRDRHDLERWGRWWYLDNEVVSVRIGYPDLNVTSPSGWWDGPVNPSHRWAGPVAPPPEVRS